MIDKYDFIGNAVVGLCVVLIVLLVAGAGVALTAAARGNLPSQVAERECIADGNKPYVCYALIYGGRHK